MSEANRSRLVESLKAAESKLSQAEKRVQEIQDTKDTAELLATKVDEAEKMLGASQEHVQHLEVKQAEQSSQLLAKDAEAGNKCEYLSKIDR